MVRVSRVVPKEWEKYSTVGGVIPRTRFIVFKTPLNDSLLNRVHKDSRFNVNSLLHTLVVRGHKLGMVVDLTDTDRYYDKHDIENMCIEYRKINCPGRGFVGNEDHVNAFNDVIQDYIDGCEDADALIGVHCTDGVNRSGYLICRFLIERLGWTSHEALEAFESARGHSIANGAYVQALHKAAIKSREKMAGSSSDSETRHKRKKKSKKRRDDESVAHQIGFFQQFLGHVEQQAQELEEASSITHASPSFNNSQVQSPAQQSWVQPKRAKIVDEIADEIEDDGTEEAVDYYEEQEGEALQYSKAQRRRMRKQKKENMLRVMRRGNFHEIQEMQEKIYSEHAAKQEQQQDISE